MTYQDVKHDTLVKAARVWLEAQGCRVVATEFASSVSETPDAIGWRNDGRCIVVECKVSRADFRANNKKAHERGDFAVGDERWFLVPGGMVDKSEVPEGWGCLEYKKSAHSRGYFCKKLVAAPNRDKNGTSELIEKRMLVSMAARALEALRLVRPLSYGYGEEKRGEDMSGAMIDDAVSFLNEVNELDPAVMKWLMRVNLVCNEELAAHPDINVGKYGFGDCNTYTIGLLGFINGIFAKQGAEAAIVADIIAECCNCKDKTGNYGSRCNKCGGTYDVGEVVQFKADKSDNYK